MDDARSRRNEKGQLELYLGGFFARNAGVRHEVYHLKKHSDKHFSPLKHLWIEEPRTLFYEIFRI